VPAEKCPKGEKRDTVQQLAEFLIERSDRSRISADQGGEAPPATNAAMNPDPPRPIAIP
jgi:hypothetical protein